MKISREQVLHVATLARLSFTDEEVDRFTAQLSSVLEYVDKLSELDLDGVEPMAHVHATLTTMRDDTSRTSLPREELLANAPETEGGCFRVPQVIES